MSALVFVVTLWQNNLVFDITVCDIPTGMQGKEMFEIEENSFLRAAQNLM